MASDSTVVSFANIESFVPDTYVASQAELAMRSSPRILKSHECFDAGYRRVIYIVRDPRDVAASYRAYLVKMNFIAPDDPVGTFVKRFVAGELDSYGTWRQNVESWLGARHDDREFLAVRYEDLRADPIGVLTRIAGFAGLKSDPEQLARAVSASEIGAMRRLERETGRARDVSSPRARRREGGSGRGRQVNCLSR
jgi:hypothetical protein